MPSVATLVLTSFCLIAHCPVPVPAQADDAPASVPCAPLADYVDPKYQESFDIFMAGGDVPPNLPVFLTVPRISRFPTKLCIEDLPIPTSIGDVPCDDWQKCWLIMGTHTGSNLSPNDVRYCKSSNPYRGTAPCYACTCTGSDFGTGSVPPDRILSGGCGLSSQNSWGTSCPDVGNGRRYYNVTTGAEEYSNYSTVQINICGGNADYCDICRGGGYLPEFRVGLQWSNRMEQCFENNPFASGGSVAMLRHALALSVIAAIVSLLFVVN